MNSRLGIRQLGDLLQTRNQDGKTPIELLVLSACKTAKGDNRAALGLAGGGDNISAIINPTFGGSENLSGTGRSSRHQFDVAATSARFTLPGGSAVD